MFLRSDLLIARVHWIHCLFTPITRTEYDVKVGIVFVLLIMALANSGHLRGEELGHYLVPVHFSRLFSVRFIVLLIVYVVTKQLLD